MKHIKSIILSLTIITVIVLECIVPASASGQDIQSFVFDNGETIISFDVSDLSEDDIDRIISAVLNADSNEEDSSTMGLWCTLFGHNMEYREAIVIEHKVYSNSPRCIQKKYNVGICSRCDHETSELIDSFRIVCCS